MPEVDLRALLERVSPDSVLLASDYDGTLAEITDRPENALPRPEALAALRELTPRLGRVLILSGRSENDLRRFLPVPGLELRGEHGLPEPSPAERAALDRLEAAARRRLPPGAWLERKPASLSLHYRGAPYLAAEVERLAAELAAELGLSWRRGRLVAEVFPARADKARTLGAEIERMRPGAVLFAGDDLGDRSCFELVAGLDLPHLAVGVASSETDPELFSACDLVVSGPAAWAGLLSQLASWARARDRAGPSPAG